MSDARHNFGSAKASQYAEELRLNDDIGHLVAQLGMAKRALFDSQLQRGHRLALFYIINSMRDGNEAVPSAEALAVAMNISVPATWNCTSGTTSPMSATASPRRS